MMDETGLFRPLLLRAAGISKRFGDLIALDGVDFDVPRHGIVSLIGRNGSGKTVFFNVLTGFSRPDSGMVWFNGHKLLHRAPDAITARGIARTFQSIRLFANMTALENVLVGQHSQLRSGILGAIWRPPATISEETDAAARAQELLRLIGLGDAADSLAKNLPYGAQRRLEIARALGSNPLLLLLDEPTAGMNSQEAAGLLDLLARLRAEQGLTILLIEHNMKLVMNVSDRVTVLDYGVKIAEGTPSEVRADLRVVETYLGGPLREQVLLKNT